MGSVITTDDDGDDLWLFFHGKITLDGVDMDEFEDDEDDFKLGFVSCENQCMSHVGDELLDILSPCWCCFFFL